jgi:iron complex transport system ATP-binding protein
MVAMHDLNLVSFFADQVALMLDGQLVCIGSPSEVIQEDYISDAYQTAVEIVSHPVTGAPVIFPKKVLDYDRKL